MDPMDETRQLIQAMSQRASTGMASDVLEFNYQFSSQPRSWLRHLTTACAGEMKHCAAQMSDGEQSVRPMPCRIFRIELTERLVEPY